MCIYCRELIPFSGYETPRSRWLSSTLAIVNGKEKNQQ